LGVIGEGEGRVVLVAKWWSSRTKTIRLETTREGRKRLTGEGEDDDAALDWAQGRGGSG
jgi:hypothetical protein